MSHSLSQNWVHWILVTKYREPVINAELEPLIYDYITAELEELNCEVREINGMPDHIHVLFLLHQEHAMAKVARRVKARRSMWVNKQGFLPNRFQWKTGYAAFSVSLDHLYRVDGYIKKQKRHHAEKGLREELEVFPRLLE